MGEESLPGHVCPFCRTDCSPIAAGPPCRHYFLTDGENGWRFSGAAREAHDAAHGKSPALFRDLLYHDPDCREHLRLRRSDYEDSLEMYVYSEEAPRTAAAFRAAIARAE